MILSLAALCLVAVLISPTRHLSLILVIALFSLPSSGWFQPVYLIAAVVLLRLLVSQDALLLPGQTAIGVIALVAAFMIGASTAVNLAIGNSLYFSLTRLLDEIGNLFTLAVLAMSVDSAVSSIGYEQWAVQWARWITWLATVPALAQFALGARLFKTDYLFDGRLTVLSQEDPNFSAYFLVISTILAAYLVAHRRHGLWLLALNALALALTFSRSGLAAAAIGVVVLGLLDPAVRHRAPALAMGVMALVVSVALLQGQLSWADRVVEVLRMQDRRLQSLGNVEARVGMWAAYGEHALTHNWLTGMGAFDYKALGYDLTKRPMSAHSVPISVLTTTGILGLTLLLALYIRYLAWSVDQNGFERGLLVALGVGELAMAATVGYQPLWGMAVLAGAWTANTRALS